MFFVVVLLFSLFLVVGSKKLSIVLDINKPNNSKLSPFECGFPEFENARSRFDVKFYLVAILFLAFDIELAFMLPWSVLVRRSDNFSGISWPAFIAMILFLFILFVGLLYEWKKGALEWE
jgi:NADH-quinone oxidoreductase subunit A